MKITSLRFALPACAYAGMLAGCAGTSLSSGGTGLPATTPQSAPSRAVAPAKKQKGHTMFVADRGSNSALGFPSTATGNVAPTVTISGSNTLLGDPLALAADSAGDLYVANDSDHQLEIFPAGSNGNVTPQVLGGSNVPFSRTEGVAVDRAGLIYVSDYEADAVYIFAAGATGNTAPIRTIVGSNTGLTEPIGMAFDSGDNLYVANYNSSGATIVEFAAGANGNATPIGTLGIAGGGGNSTLYGAFNLAINSKGDLIVGNDATSAVDIFKHGAKGDVAPNVIISGAATGIATLTSVGVDSKGFIYVTSVFASPGDAVLVFTPKSKGNVAPVRTLQGANTGLSDPFYPTFH